MKKKLLFLAFAACLVLSACDLPTKEEEPSLVTLMILLWNYELMAYEVYVNDTKYVTIPGRDPDHLFCSGYFVMAARLNDTNQLEIKNAGYVYDAISFSVAEHAVRIEPGGPYSGVADYGIDIFIRGGRLSFED